VIDIAGGEDVVAIMTSLIFWAFVLALVLGLAVGPRYIRSRERQKLYDLMKVAYEKGQQVPPELIASLTRETTSSGQPMRSYYGRNADLRRAIVLIAVGLGVAVLGMGLSFGLSFASHLAGAIVGGILIGCGAIPGFIGVAYLILWMASGGNRRAPEA
jgi:hypothetical protein